MFWFPFVSMGWFEAILGVAVVIVLLNARRRMLVLQRCETEPATRRVTLPLVEIVGRRAGLTALLQQAIGIDPTTTFSVTEDEVLCEESTVFGKGFRVIPVAQVSGLAAGVRKPIEYLVLFVVLFTAFAREAIDAIRTDGDLDIASLVILGLAAFCLGYFVLGRYLYIVVRSSSGKPIPIRFKPALLEGKFVDEQTALTAIATIRELVVAANRRTLGESNEPPPLLHAAEPPRDAGPREGGGGDARPDEPENEREPEPEPRNEEKEARRIYERARRLFDDGRRDQALELLRALIRRFPHTKAARVAGAALAEFDPP